MAQELTLVPFKPGGVYARGEKVGWAVSAAAGKSAERYNYTLRKNNLEVIKTGLLDVPRPATIEVTLDEPAMVFLEVKSTAPDAKAQVAGAAVAPTELQPSVPTPRDFDEFWAAKIAMLQKVPANPVLTPKPSDKPNVDYSTLRMDHIEGRHIHGQVAKPTSARASFPGS